MKAFWVYVVSLGLLATAFPARAITPPPTPKITGKKGASGATSHPKVSCTLLRRGDILIGKMIAPHDFITSTGCAFRLRFSGKMLALVGIASERSGDQLVVSV